MRSRHITNLILRCRRSGAPSKDVEAERPRFSTGRARITSFSPRISQLSSRDREGHAEQAVLQRAGAGHQRRHPALLDAARDRHLVQHHRGRLAAAIGGVDRDVVAQEIHRQADHAGILQGQHHAGGAGVDQHRDAAVVDLDADALKSPSRARATSIAGPSAWLSGTA